MSATHQTQYVVLGAGPAGLQIAYCLEKAGRDYVIVEGADHVGAFFSTHPRHRQLISINKRFTGRDDDEFNFRHDWNSLVCDDPELRLGKMTKEYFPPADTLVEYLAKYAEQYKLKVHLNRWVEKVSRDAETRQFRLECASGDSYECQVLIVATGVNRPNIPDIPGIELATGYEEMSVDPEDYVNKNVLVLGKGNSAFETADNLVPTAAIIHLMSPTPVKLAWNTRFVGNLRAVNNNFLDTYHLKSQNAIIDGNIQEMRRTKSGSILVKFASIHVDNETEQLEYDHVLRCTGWRFDDRFYDDSCKPEMTDCGRFPRMDFGFESTNVPDMFFVGASNQSLDYKKAQSAFIHGFRYNAVSLGQLLERRYHEQELDYDEIDPEPETLSKAVLEHMNRVSSLWQQVGFMADLLALPKPGESKARYYHNLPYEYLREHGSELSGGRDFYIIMFRLGYCPKDVFDHERVTNPFEGEMSTAIHPVFEMWKGGASEPASDFHVLEDFLADWSGHEYHEATTAYFTSSQRGEATPKKKLEGVRDIVRDQHMRLVDPNVGQAP